MVKAFKVTVAGATMAMAALSLTAPAQAGNGSAVGAGLAGFGIGLSSVARLRRARSMWFHHRRRRRSTTAPWYGPPPWTPGWYDYCARRYPGFNPQTGYFVGPDGQPYFCR